jgi:signal transduction protein with GAF and PtsI domain
MVAHWRPFSQNAIKRSVEDWIRSGTGQSVLIHIQEGQEKQPWIARPDWVTEQKIRSIAAQPLIFNKQILGVLGVFSRNPISAPEFTWLRAFADQVAVAITTARNADQLRALLGESREVIKWEITIESTHHNSGLTVVLCASKSCINVDVADENGKYFAAGSLR